MGNDIEYFHPVSQVSEERIINQQIPIYTTILQQDTEGRRGTSITLMTQFDVERILNIEKVINLKMEEIHFNQEKVLVNMSGVSKATKTIKIKMQQDGTTEKFIDMQKKKVKQKQEATNIEQN